MTQYACCMYRDVQLQAVVFNLKYIRAHSFLEHMNPNSTFGAQRGARTHDPEIECLVLPNIVDGGLPDVIAVASVYIFPKSQRTAAVTNPKIYLTSYWEVP